MGEGRSPHLHWIGARARLIEQQQQVAPRDVRLLCRSQRALAGSHMRCEGGGALLERLRVAHVGDHRTEEVDARPGCGGAGGRKGQIRGRGRVRGGGREAGGIGGGEVV